MVDFYNHVKHCTTHPKFLHSNSTSHRWVFGAIAELIDNAIDPDVSASQFCIDMKEFGGEPCLVFMDNGCGLVPEKLHKMLSFGHSKKQMTPGDRSIGKHGNGFKSGTMRLGRDVLVLTKCADSMTAGFLSQTFLADTRAEDILIPQVSWDLNGHRLSPMDLEIEESLRAICKFSIFPDEDSLLAQLEAIPVTGAILIISNLRRHEGVLELDFETDPHDIRIASEINSSHFQQLRPNQPNTTEVPMDYSLRAYVSILYKVPRMQVFIRDKKVKTKRIAGILSQKETESYKPYGVAESIKIELGFNTENKSLYGMMLYHRNRLIKAYMRVGMQLEENERGMGVIGLAEADFLQPTHNKQDFDDTTAYRRLLKKLSDVLAEYWWEKKERIQGPQLQLEPRAFRRAINLSTSEDIPDVIWVQCDNPACLKWRILPSGTDVSVLPDIWYCEYHPDEKFRNHEEPEQEWDPSVQHEIIERRRERKREYDREKKEREAERKRQRLEAATKDNQEILQKEREALAKEVQLQEARGEVAQKDLKLREEELKKMSEEYAAVLAASDELKRQLELTKAELYRKDKEKEGTALVLTQQVHSEEEAQEEPLAVCASMNGHVEEEQDEPAFLGAVSNKEGGSMRKHPQDRERTGRRRHGVSRSATVLPVSASPPVHQATIESNGNLHGHDGNGGPPLHTSGNLYLPAAPPRSPVQRPRELQASQPLHIAQTSLVALSKELIARGTSGAPQQSQHKGTGVHVASAQHRKRSSKASLPSQPAAIELPTLQEVQVPTPGLDVGQRIPPGEVPPVAVGAMPPVPAPSYPMFTPIPCQATNSAMLTAAGYSSDLNQQTQQGPTTGLAYRPSELADSAHQDLLSPPLAANGASFEYRCEDLFSEQDVEQSSESHQFRGVGNGRHIMSDSGAPLSGLRLVLPQQQNSMSLDSGMISVHLPMDSMLSTSNSRSEAEITLDKAVYSLQRRLRLTLNTLLKLGGSGDSNLIELDGLPSQDSEVVSICEKANQHVETMMQNGRQEAAKLKAELAYLMADKMQHGQGRNFKIQSIANRWDIGMEVSKQG